MVLSNGGVGPAALNKPHRDLRVDLRLGTIELALLREDLHHAIQSLRTVYRRSLRSTHHLNPFYAARINRRDVEWVCHFHTIDVSLHVAEEDVARPAYVDVALGVQDARIPSNGPRNTPAEDLVHALVAPPLSLVGRNHTNRRRDGLALGWRHRSRHHDLLELGRRRLQCDICGHLLLRRDRHGVSLLRIPDAARREGVHP